MSISVRSGARINTRLRLQWPRKMWQIEKSRIDVCNRSERGIRVSIREKMDELLSDTGCRANFSLRCHTSTADSAPTPRTTIYVGMPRWGTTRQLKVDSLTVTVALLADRWLWLTDNFPKCSLDSLRQLSGSCTQSLQRKSLLTSCHGNCCHRTPLHEQSCVFLASGRRALTGVNMSGKRRWLF